MTGVMSFEEMLDEIDSSVYSGDALESEDNRKIFKECLDRWNRRMQELD